MCKQNTLLYIILYISIFVWTGELRPYVWICT
nr:MAG TPA: hypothetical protein [Caudoviricetes sp.]